jgi:glycosyltransferase involved in cell wall biosynthesis
MQKPVLLIVTEAALENPQAKPLSAADRERVNGVYRTYENLAPHLADYFDVHFLTPFDYKGPEKSLLKAAFKKNTPSSAPGQKSIRLVFPSTRDIAQRLEKIKPYHIHVATEGPLGLKVLRFAKKNKIPVSTAFHTNWQQYVLEDGLNVPLLPRRLTAKGVKSLLASFHKAAQATMAATEELKKDLSGWGIAPEKIHIVSRGIDTAVFRRYPDEERPVPEEYILFVGRLSPGKGAEDFCKLDARGLKKIVVGTGPLDASLREKYPDVTFMGFRQGEELGRFYSGAKFFVMPSTTETLGMTVMEALACGTPVIAPNVGGHQPIILARSGLGILDGDMQRGLDRAIADPNQFLARQEMSAFMHETRSWKAEAQNFFNMAKAAETRVNTTRPKPGRGA